MKALLLFILAVIAKKVISDSLPDMSVQRLVVLSAGFIQRQRSRWQYFREGQYLTAKQALRLYPGLVSLQWSEQRAADVMRTGGMVGKYDVHLKRYYFTKWSIEAYLEFVQRMRQNSIQLHGT